MNHLPSFRVETRVDGNPYDTVIAAFPTRDMAGITTVDYTINTTAVEKIAHIRGEGTNDIATIRDGEPHHPIRVYNAPGLELTFLYSEVFLPMAFADRLAAAIEDWCRDAGVELLTIVHGATFPHSEEDHVPFFAASDGYRDRALSGVDGITGLPVGVLDGLPGELLLRGTDAAGIDTGVLVTPAHLPGPDIDAALTLLEAVQAVHDVTIDDTALRERGEELREYYRGLVDRSRATEISPMVRDFPEDRMFM